jgi:hypothetical protein
MYISTMISILGTCLFSLVNPGLLAVSENHWTNVTLLDDMINRGEVVTIV